MKRFPAALLVSAWLYSTLFASCQTSADINTILQKSKLVDTGRAVNATVRGDAVTISTYCDQAATDRDCKITALMMMKELRSHYKNIHRAQVLFFSQIDPASYREVGIREGDALLIDRGTSPTEVLAQIDVVRRTSRQPAHTATRNYNVRNDSMKTMNALATPAAGNALLKMLVMQVANNFGFSRSAQVVLDKHLRKSVNGQLSRSDRTALYKDLREQLNHVDQRDQATFALRQAFEVLGGVDD